MREHFCLRFLLSVVTVAAVTLSIQAQAATLRTEVLTPGAFSKATIKDLESIQMKLAAPGYVERVSVALTFKTPQAKVIVMVNGRARGEISAPMRMNELEIDVRDSAASIDFYSASGIAQIDGVIAVLSAPQSEVLPSVAVDSRAPGARSGDILRLMKTAERDLEALSRYLQPEDNLGILVPAQSAIREVVISVKAGRSYADTLPHIRLLKTQLQKLEPIVTRSRAVSSRTERELANAIYIWSADVQGLAD